MQVEPLIVSCQEQKFKGMSNKFGLVHLNKVIPKGYITVYIGEEQECFIVPIKHLHSSDKSHFDSEWI